MEQWKTYGKNCRWAIRDNHGYLMEISALRRDAIIGWLENFSPDRDNKYRSWQWWYSQGYRAVKVFIKEVV